MELSTKFVRSQLALLKTFVSGSSLETARKGQDKLGALMSALHKGDVTTEEHSFELFECAMITPRDETASGVILYLHGGGYTCGDLEYAKGFGTILAAKCGIRVFCVAYRLAPESIFPAALDDALTAYRYLIRKAGFAPSDIVLCGESAGGGLIYSLCLKLKSLGEPLPAGIIGISPWTDLTMSGGTFESNKEVDPSMTRERLEFFSDCYVHGTPRGIADKVRDHEMKKNPLVSPLFGDVGGFPPSLLFVGGDEVMLDDARVMQQNLLDRGCLCQIAVAPKMWHAYVLYCLKENSADFDKIRTFLKMVLPRPKKLHWMRLDNAAKIYPAARRRDWSNVFRLSATLIEPVDRSVLKSALDVTVRRFPSIAVRIRRGLFWYYLEEIPRAPEIMDEAAYPLARMPFDDIRKCAFRILVYENRIALEVFHALTDGNGGLIFLKTLVAEYLTQKYNAGIPASAGVLDRLEEPKEEELEDSFLKHSGPVSLGRRDTTAFKLSGTSEPDGFSTDTTFMMSASQIRDKAKEHGVTVTAFLTAAMICAVLKIQEKQVSSPRRRLPVKILIPVDLRKLYGSSTLRNFVLYITPGVDPRLGEYTFDEVCAVVHHHMGTEITKKQMSRRIAANVNSEKAVPVKILPLFIKNLALKAAFNIVGEKKSCFSLSNLGVVKMPDEMRSFITRMDFVLEVQSRAPYNCGVITFGDTLYLNIIRNIKESILEYHFYEELKTLGIKVKAESNQRCEDERK